MAITKKNIFRIYAKECEGTKICLLQKELDIKEGISKTNEAQRKLKKEKK